MGAGRHLAVGTLTIPSEPQRPFENLGGAFAGSFLSQSVLSVVSRLSEELQSHFDPGDPPPHFPAHPDPILTPFLT